MAAETQADPMNVNGYAELSQVSSFAPVCREKSATPRALGTRRPRASITGSSSDACMATRGEAALGEAVGP